jgi:hypothetical protein
MTRKTSIATFIKIKEEGLLSDLRFKVYEIIYKNQPITISQMIREASRSVTNTGSFTGRISELKKMDMIYEHHEGPCPVTGRNVIFWATTDSLPKKLEKEPTRTERKKLIIKMLREIYPKYPDKEIIKNIAREVSLL